MALLRVCYAGIRFVRGLVWVLFCWRYIYTVFFQCGSKLADLHNKPVVIMKAVILDLDTLAPSDLDLSVLIDQADDWQLYPHTSPSQLIERIADADIVLTNKVVLDDGAIAAAAKLQLIAVMATGTNNVNLQAASKRGVVVCNAAAYSTPSVVQHCFALMLALATRLPDYMTAVNRGQWQLSRQFCLLDFPIQELADKTLGIIGYGNLGQKVASVAKAFDMKVLVAESFCGNSNDGRVPLDALLADSDVVSLHCPLNEQTKHLLSRQKLALMKPTAWLINTARGGIVDEGALAEALKNASLAGAAMDVLAEEPPQANSVLLQGDIPNLLMTPHSAWGSRESRQRLVYQLAEVIAAFYRHQPIQQVN